MGHSTKICHSHATLPSTLNFIHSYKFKPQSHPCVFVGHSNEHNAYSCLDLKTNRIFISCYIIFVEPVFLFKNSSILTLSIPYHLLNQWLNLVYSNTKKNSFDSLFLNSFNIFLLNSSHVNVKNHSHHSPILNTKFSLTQHVLTIDVNPLYHRHEILT